MLGRSSPLLPDRDRAISANKSALLRASTACTRYCADTEEETALAGTLVGLVTDRQLAYDLFICFIPSALRQTDRQDRKDEDEDARHAFPVTTIEPNCPERVTGSAAGTG